MDDLEAMNRKRKRVGPCCPAVPRATSGRGVHTQEEREHIHISATHEDTPAQIPQKSGYERIFGVDRKDKDEKAWTDKDLRTGLKKERVFDAIRNHDQLWPG